MPIVDECACCVGRESFRRYVRRDHVHTYPRLFLKFITTQARVSISSSYKSRADILSISGTCTHFSGLANENAGRQSSLSVYSHTLTAKSLDLYFDVGEIIF